MREDILLSERDGISGWGRWGKDSYRASYI